MKKFRVIESEKDWENICECVCQTTEVTFSSMLHTHTHNNEICSSLPFSPPLIRASCGLLKMAWLEVCWYIRPHRHTLLVERRNQPCPFAWFCAKLNMAHNLPRMAWWFYMIYMILVLLCLLMFVCCLSLFCFVFFLLKVPSFFGMIPRVFRVAENRELQ